MTTGDPRATINELRLKKKEIEDTARQSEELLDRLGVGRTGSLVDEEGFPLKDVDLYLVRSKRNEISCSTPSTLSYFIVILSVGLINDHKQVMKEIEELLPLAFSTPHLAPKSPFAVVTRVQPGSLSHSSGLCPGDLILQFGQLDRTTVTSASSLSLLSGALEAHRSKQLLVKVRRSTGIEHTLTFDLTASTGPIQLGCHLDFMP